MNKNKITDMIAELRTYNGRLRPKYLRNLRLYTYSMNISLDTIKEGGTIGYWQMLGNSNYTSSINENVIQSCIDALTSQLCSKNALPSITTVNGTFAQQQVAKQAEQYFTSLYEEQDVNKTVTNAFKDACIFGVGAVFIDNDTKTIAKVLPWQLHYRPAEEVYGKLTRIYYERKAFPVTLLPFSYKTSSEYVTYGLYFDTVNHIKATLVDNTVVKVEEYAAPVLPFTFLHYSNPLVGRDSLSVVDILYGIQMKLDEAYSTIAEAIKRNPAQTFVVPEGSGVKVSQLNNRVGQILTYKPIEGVTNPVTAVTPNFIADQYLSFVEQLKNDAYKLVGISELSSQGRKPAGLDSGKALKTMNDLESERFEVQYKQVINAYVDIAKKCIWLFDGTILPDDSNRLPIYWDSLRENISKLKIHFSALDFLSKDPSTKFDEIQMLVANGIIPRSRAAIYYGMPDSDAAYSYANNSINAVLAVINQAIVSNDFEIPDYVPLDLLKSEITNTLLNMKSVENVNNQDDIEKLKLLYQEVLNKQKVMNSQVMNEQAQADEQAFNTGLQRQLQTQGSLLRQDLEIKQEYDNANANNASTDLYVHN